MWVKVMCGGGPCVFTASEPGIRGAQALGAQEMLEGTEKLHEEQTFKPGRETSLSGFLWE